MVLISISGQVFAAENCHNILDEINPKINNEESFNKLKKAHIKIFGEFDFFKIYKLQVRDPENTVFTKSFYKELGGYYLGVLAASGKANEVTTTLLLNNGVIASARDITGSIPIVKAILMKNNEFINVVRESESFNESEYKKYNRYKNCLQFRFNKKT